MTLPTSGPISLEAIANNNSSASLSNLSLQTESQRFASASIVGDVDGNGTANQSNDRALLTAAPHALSEFRGANFPSSIITGITFTTDGSDTNTVDGEDLDVAFTTNGQAGTYTVRLIDSGGNTDASTTRSGAGTVTFSNLSLTEDTYRPQVEFNTFNIVNDDATFEHHDAIGTITITDPSDTTVANNSATTNIEHQISITNDNAFNDINWTFAKSSGPGSAPSNITNSSDRSPTVSYTGVGIFTIDCRVDGTPSQARNSSTAAQVTHRIDFSKSVTVNNPSSLNEGSTITALGNHQGFSSGIDVDLIQSSDNSVLLSNDDTTDSRQSITAYNKTFTAPARTDSTLSVKVKSFDGSDSATSNAFNIYPLISQQFDANDLSFGASSVKVNTNITLDVANDVTDNIVGYQWSNQGTGNMSVQSGNASAGDTDGSANDSVSIIDLTDQSHPTVRFDTAQENKTIRLSLFGRLNQTATADKTINVELANSISSVGVDDTTINSGQSFTISATVAGVQSKTLRIGYGTANNDTSYTDSADKSISDTRFSTSTQTQAFTRNLTSGTSLETFFPKANITDGTIGVSAGSSFQVAPAFSYNTPGDVTINVNETRALDISSIVGHNVSVVITSSPDKGSGTNTATLSPGTLNDVYTISYDGAASFGQTSDATDTITVNPTVSVARSSATGNPTADTDGVSISSTSHGISPTTFTFTPTAVGTSLGFTYNMASGFSFTSGNANTAGAIQGTFNSAGSKSNALQVASNGTSATDGFSVTLDSITKDFDSCSTEAVNDGGMRAGGTVDVTLQVDFVKRAKLQRQLADTSFEDITGTTTISHGGGLNQSGDTTFTLLSNATPDGTQRTVRIVDVDRTANTIVLPNNLSASSTFTMLAPLAVVNSFSASAPGTLGRITISWNVSNAKTTSGAIVIKRSTASNMSGATTILTTTTTAGSHNDDSLAGNTTFYYQLTALNPSDEATNSSIENATTPLNTVFSNIPTLSIPYTTEDTMDSDVFKITLSQGTGNTTIRLDNNVSSDLREAQILVAASTSDSTPSSFSELNAVEDGGLSTVSVAHTTGDLFMAFRVNDDDGNIPGTDDDAFNVIITNNGVTANPAGVFRSHTVSSTDSSLSQTFQEALAQLSNATTFVSDNMQISIAGCTVGDVVTFKCERTNGSGALNNLGDITVKFAVYESDGASTAAYDSSGNLLSGALESAAITSTNTTQTVSGITLGSSGLARFRARFRSQSDGVMNQTEGPEDATFRLKVKVENSSGHTINDRTVYTYTVNANPFS